MIDDDEEAIRTAERIDPEAYAVAQRGPRVIGGEPCVEGDGPYRRADRRLRT